MKIKEIKAREILDSRSNPTLEVTMVLENPQFHLEPQQEVRKR